LDACGRGRHHQRRRERERKSLRAHWQASFGAAAKGVPTILVDDGEPLTSHMHRARISVEDIMERARVLHGLESLSQIKYAILEASGKISIIPREKPPRPRKKAAAKNSG